MVKTKLLEVEGKVFKAVLTEDEDGWWVAEIPELPGCVSQGRSYTEAVENIQEAALCYLHSL